MHTCLGVRACVSRIFLCRVLASHIVGIEVEEWEKGRDLRGLANAHHLVGKVSRRVKEGSPVSPGSLLMS